MVGYTCHFFFFFFYCFKKYNVFVCTEPASGDLSNYQKKIGGKKSERKIWGRKICTNDPHMGELVKNKIKVC